MPSDVLKLFKEINRGVIQSGVRLLAEVATERKALERKIKQLERGEARLRRMVRRAARCV